MSAQAARVIAFTKGHTVGKRVSPLPPAQIPACAANAPGSSLGFWRRSGDKVEGVGS